MTKFKCYRCGQEANGVLQAENAWAVCDYAAHNREDDIEACGMGNPWWDKKNVDQTCQVQRTSNMSD